MQKERYQSQINQNFGTVCHTEACLTFLRLADKRSEMIPNKLKNNNINLGNLISKFIYRNFGWLVGW